MRLPLPLSHPRHFPPRSLRTALVQKFAPPFFIHNGSIPYLILFVLCQVSMCTSQKESSPLFHPVNKHCGLEYFISSQPKGPRRRHCLTPGVCRASASHSLAVSPRFCRLGFVCNPDVCAGLCSVTYLTRVHSLESTSTRRTERGFDSTLCTSINKLTILSQSEGKIQLFTNCNA